MASKPKTDRMAWFKFDAGTFIADTTGLSHVHVAIYARLQALYWVYGTELNLTDVQLKRKLAVDDAEGEEALFEVIAEFFPRDPGGKLCHEALDKQLREVKEYSQSQSEKGKQRQAKTASPKPEGTKVIDAEDDDQF